MSWFHSCYNRLTQIEQLDPVRDCVQICSLLAGYEFPWDITRALELAMLKTYCVPSVSKLLDKTGEFHHHTQKRYDDTGLMVAEIMKWGYESDRGKESIRRMNMIHGHYQISNEDFLYVLSTFIYEPIRWNKCFGWRLFTETERLGIFYFWQAIGTKMAIENIPNTYDEFDQYNQDYEQKYFVYSDTNKRVGESTLNLFLSWYPSFIRPSLKPCVQSLFDERSLSAFGWSNPPFWIRNLVVKSLKLRGRVAKLLPPRQKPDFFTDSKIKSYPDGYTMKDLGPEKMLDKLNEY
ncbi:MAG: oxygenase MpaB family protein [Pleurocapsa sp.]